MGTVKVECVVKEQNEIGEGPVWEEKDASLMYVDIYGPKISRWNSLTNQIESMRTGEAGQISASLCIKTIIASWAVGQLIRLSSPVDPLTFY